MNIAGQAVVISKNTEINPNKCPTMNPTYRYNIPTAAFPAIQRLE
jgi:hypothetical protein